MIQSALAAARPRLKLDVFDDLYGTLRAARESFTEALLLLSATNVQQPEQKRILKYCIDFMLAQAHRIVLWRCSEEQLARAQSAPSSVGGIQQDDFETYKSKLQSLRVRSAEEAFQAARRIMSNITVCVCALCSAKALILRVLPLGNLLAFRCWQCRILRTRLFHL